MLEGLWSIELGIKETKMQGAGVVVFENQRVLGGSNNYFYTGRYEVKKDLVKGWMFLLPARSSPSAKTRDVFKGYGVIINWIVRNCLQY